MIGALAGLLLTAQAPAPFDLGPFLYRSRFDGLLVEFDAYVVLMQRPGGPLTLAATTGAVRTFADGRRVNMCDDNPETSVAVILDRNGLGPLSARAARPPNAYVGVRIRGILRDRYYSFRVGAAEHEWVGSVDHARIVRVNGERCQINLPD